ncbi:flavin reductase family protein [Streptomyces sp. NPDC005438]|uniref:flavin reductase family protein n=1 Tax=Streptomyces sp. NPDC005438 TaxID=3156880 RepID=UPI0033B0FDFB
MDTRETVPIPTAERVDLFRTAFRGHPAGVAVVTAAGERPTGFTATSLISVSARPPALAFGIDTGSSSWPVFARADHVGVHLLTRDQTDLAARFARSGVDRFAGTEWRPGPHRVPLLADPPAHLVCRVLSRVAAGDHHLVVAEVECGQAAEDWSPLLYHRGGFAEL